MVVLLCSHPDFDLETAVPAKDGVLQRGSLVIFNHSVTIFYGRLNHENGTDNIIIELSGEIKLTPQDIKKDRYDTFLF